MSDQEDSALGRLAHRLSSDPRYMSYVLAAYQRQEGLTDEGLVAELGTFPAMVVRLALCKRPSALSAQFAEQVRELADYTLTDEGQLASIIRQVDALEELARRPASSNTQEESQPAHLTGLLAVARDRDETASDESSLEAESEAEE